VFWRQSGRAHHGTNAAARHGRDAIHANSVPDGSTDDSAA
jgi:hypothetical protein